MPADNDEDRTVLAAGAAASAMPAQPAPTAVEDVLPIGTRLGEFEIIGLIGQGGFGIVYLCEDHSLGRHVAVKEYMPSSLAQRTSGTQVSVKSSRHAETFEAGRRSFVNEARLLAQFDHHSLVKVYRFWEANGTAYMVMPYYEGQTLKQALSAMPAAPDELYLKHLLVPVMDALEAMHRAQIFHRDIAPDNIMLLKNGRPLLLDFGAARRVIGDMTQALTVILKPGYAPIEQYAEVEHMKQGAWTDIYALAAVIYFAITGKTPVPSVGRVMNDPYVPLAQSAAGRYSAQFLRGIDRALAVKPEDRPQTIAEFRDLLGIDAALITVIRAETPPRSATTSSNPGSGSIPSKSGLKSPLIAAGAIAMLVALATGAYLLFGKGSGLQTVETQNPTLPPSSAPRPADSLEARVPVLPIKTPKPPESAPAFTNTRPFNPADELDAIFQKRNRDHNVAVELDQARVRIGRDRLHFRLRSSKPGYVYVLMVGTDGQHFYLLFPNAIDSKNRIEAGQEISLPRSGWAMVAGGPAGTNQFVAVVAENPHDFGQAGLVKVDPFAEFPFDTAAQVAKSSPGQRSPFLGTVVCPGGGNACSDAYGAAMFTIEEIDAPDRAASARRNK